ncbi:MAG: alpha/beta hydrolase [Rhodospirillales bacterium]|nr:alpha/beta hydrolase [Rhodospirillales bacterium]
MTDNWAPGEYRSIWSDLHGVSFSQGFKDANGIRTRYLHSGSDDKPVVIFLHGTGGHAEAYSRNIGPHGEHFSTWAIDMLGHGLTDKPDYDYEIPRYIDHIAGFLDSIGADKASLSGESLGGWVAAAFASAHPDRVDKLVLNTAASDRVKPGALESLRATTLAAVEDPNWPAVRARLEWLMFDNDDVHDDLIATRQRIYAAPEMLDGVRHILCLHTVEARREFAVTKDQWNAIAAPTLVLWTDHDPTATVDVGEDLAALIPGARFEVMTDCGHWPQFEDADTFNKLHIDFLLGKS